jgi:predicted alpha/beta hydrolase
MTVRWPVRASDGHSFELLVAKPERAQAALLFVSAMGVEASYYAPFAEALSQRGILVALCDLRGHGTSSLRPRRGVDFGYREIVELDIPSGVAAMKARIGDIPLYLGGHSLGGQLIMLHVAATQPDIAGVALVACAIPYHRRWTGKTRARILFASIVLPIAGFVLGYVPGNRLGFGGTEARTLMRDWAHCARTSRYEPVGSSVHYEAALAQLHLELVTVHIEGDEMAPPNAIDFIFEKVPHARGERVEAKLSEQKPGAHFRWARRPDDVVRAVANWIELGSIRKKAQ